MDEITMDKKQIRIMVAIISFAIFLSTQTQANIFFPLSSIGYSFGGAGVNANFIAIEWHYGSDEPSYEPHEGGVDGDSHLFVDLRPDTKFYFDADDPIRYAPNLVGEMTNAFVPEESLSNAPSWVPTEWFRQSTVQNPLRTEVWDLPNPDNPEEILAYEVEEWLLKMYVSITCEWDERPFDWVVGASEWFDQRYRDTEVWIELNMAQNFFIFEGSPTPYFAISKVKCNRFATGKLGQEDAFFEWEKGLGLVDAPEEYTPTPQFSVIPESTSWMYLYHNKWGQDGVAHPSDPFDFKGRQLNPEIFVDNMFISVNLANFGTFYESYWDLSSLTKGDAVTWEFDVHVFVVGEYKVQDIEELPDEYGRTPMVDYQQSALSGILGDPRFQLFSFLGLGALVICVLAIFAPWVLFAFIGMFRSGKR